MVRAGLLGLAAAVLALTGRGEAAPPKPLMVVVLGHVEDAQRLAAAAQAAQLVAAGVDRSGPLEGGVEVAALDDGGTAEGLKKAVAAARALKPVAILALPTADLDEAYWKAARRFAVPWFVLTGRRPNPLEAPEYLLYVGVSPAAQAILAADGMTAPLAAHSAAVVHEPTRYGLQLASAFARNLGSRIRLAGVRGWEPEAGEATLQALRGMEAEWIYVAMAGAPLHAFVRALAASAWRPRLVFADGGRDASLLAFGADALEGAVFLDGPDPEMHGRAGEKLVDDLERAGAPLEAVSARAYEATARVLAAVAAAGSTKLKHVRDALAPETPSPGVLGALAFDASGAVRGYATTWWRVQGGRYAIWPGGLLPTPGCGPPLAFGRPRTAARGERGRLTYLTWGSEEQRTIERDLLEIGLSTGGKDEALDALVRAEVMGRAIRIANRLFRREADGTSLAGWSWGLAFTTEPPGDDVKKSDLWLAVCAGDDEAAGGRAFGTWVAVYTSFLKRTMYLARKLDPPLTVADRRLVDGTYGWGEDRAANFRADKIRCLMDGFASAMGLTLSHELGHLCGCGHDTEHPTSIMNVVAGAGASWEDAVWIPKHEKLVGGALGLEALQDEDEERSK
ncbi:MAG: ABC transporter substrate-binding protein [Planctomycetota bacterium]|nr:ABC transporter substrate-binding protein [Planctomycetota bacterium]